MTIKVVLAIHEDFAKRRKIGGGRTQIDLTDPGNATGYGCAGAAMHQFAAMDDCQPSGSDIHQNGEWQ